MANYTAAIRAAVAGSDRIECPVTLKMYGGDFQEPDWDAGDAVIRWYDAHPEANISAFYSTPAAFDRDIRGCEKTEWKLFAPPNNDFFPYWTGFFTSQPVFKAIVRRASAILHTVRVLHALRTDAAPTFADGGGADDGAAKLNVLWRALGVMQHHDAVTGTALPFVYVDYRNRLANGIEEAQAVVSSLLGAARLCVELAVCANTNNTNTLAQPHCVEPGVPTCLGVPYDSSGTFDVTVLNPLAWDRDDVVAFGLDPQPSFSTVSVVDSGGHDIPAQLGSIDGTATVSFRAVDVPALGSRTYRVKLSRATAATARTGDGDQLQRLATSTAEVPGAMALENAHLRLDFDPHGRLVRVTNKDHLPPLVLAVSLGMRWYWASTAKDDGAYDFHTDAAHPGAHSFPGDVPGAGAARFASGPVYDEIGLTVDKDSNIELVTRLYHDNATHHTRRGTSNASGSPHFEVFATIGPVSLVAGAGPGSTTATGKDIILQINTSIASAGRFYTDSSGMELMPRQRGRGTFNNSIDPTRPGDNYYPATAIGSIRDAAAQLVWISDRSTGCGSSTDGSLEKMIYRYVTFGQYFLFA